MADLIKAAKKVLDPRNAPSSIPHIPHEIGDKLRATIRRRRR